MGNFAAGLFECRCPLLQPPIIHCSPRSRRNQLVADRAISFGVEEITEHCDASHYRGTMDMWRYNSRRSEGERTPDARDPKSVPMPQLYDRDRKKRVTLGNPKDVGALIRILDADGRFQERIP